jgi:hypothetical protein
MAEEIIQEDIVPVNNDGFPDQDPKPKSYITKVHENLVHAYGEKEVPDEATFVKKMGNSEYVKKVHENLVHAYGEKEVPDYKFFTDSLANNEKKNLGATIGNGSAPLESELSSIQTPDTFDKNANPSVLARQSFDLKQPKSVTKKTVGVDMMGMPVESNEDVYDENAINTAKEIDKHLDKLGYSKDFASTISRIPEKYKETTGYTDQELADLYKSDKNEFNKRTSNIIWRENLNDAMNEMANNINKNQNLTQEEKDAQINKITTESDLLNQGAEQYAGDLKNKQFYVGQSARNIKQFITNPEKQKQALDDLAISTADDFGSIEDLEDKNKQPLSKNINDYQSVALNYLDQIDPEKASFYRKYIDINAKDLQKFQHAGYDQLQKELDEIGLNLVVNNAKNKLKTLSDIAKQQGGQLDTQDYQEYNKLLETANTADARLSKLGLVYPNTVNADTRSIAQELTGGGSSTLGLAGKNLAYGLGKTGKNLVDIALSPFRSQQMNDNAALEALGIENYVESKTIPTKNQSALARDLPKLTPELDARVLAIKNDKKLSQAEKEEHVDQLLQSNRDKWIPASNETTWNLGPNAIFSSVANTAAKLAPFLALEVLTEGGATPSVVSSFAKMYGNVLLTSYSEELAKAMKEKSANPELDAYGSVLVNSLAFKAAGVGDIVKNIRGTANEMGGVTAKIINKLDDKAIVDALKNPNSTLKGFLNNAGQVIKEKGLEGVKTAAIFEGVLGAKDVMGGAKVDEEFIKQKALNLLTFSLFNTALGSAVGLYNVGKENKEALFLAATNKDEVLYEAQKALENKQISQSAYNQITQNVEAASKVLEKVPMVNGKGKELSRKEASELMYLKIKEQFIEDQIKKDLPKKMQDKITKDLSDVQDQIDKVYDGTFIKDIGKPFEGIEDRAKGAAPLEDINDRRKQQYDAFTKAAKADSNFDFNESFDDFNKKIDSEDGDEYLRDLYKKSKPFVNDFFRYTKNGNNEDSFVNYLTNPKSEISSFKLGYAPFREGNITDINQADKAFENKSYQAWKKMASTFAQNIGLEVISDPNVVGKYGETSELGEASSTPIVKGTDQQVELFAALMGTLAPEGQHSVMINKYDVNGKDLEHVFTFTNKEAAQDFYKNAGKYGIRDLSLTPDGNSVMFIASDKDGFDLINLTKDYEQQITGHEQNRINTRFLSQGEYSRVLDEHGNKIGGQYSEEHRQNIADAIQLAKERARRFGSDYDQKSEQAKIEAEQATQNYIDQNKKELGLPDTGKTSVKKIDPEFAVKVKDAYDALPVDDSKNPEVKSAYNKAATEIDKQFQYLTKDLGIKVEFIKDDPYKNSDEMFEDIINNKRLKVFQGGEPHPFLGESSKDENGFTANEKLRAVHDYFGHFVNRNQFGKVGEESAWVDHSKMFSPEAQRAISTETRGQNSWVNFSGVNDAAIAKMQKGNQLIKEGNITEGNKLIKEGQSEFKFAEQKVALMPEEFTDWRKYTQAAKPTKTKIVVKEEPIESKLTIETEPKIEEPVIEGGKPAKTPQEVAISKKALGDNYNFSKEFDVRGGDVVATDVLTDLKQAANENKVDLNTQIANEVNLMSKGQPEPTEHNIITAGSHLLNIDKKIAEAQSNGNLLEVENLNEQRNQVLSVLRTLGNKAGRNLGLFNLVFKDVDASEIKVTRDHLKNILNVEEVPETIAELDKSNLTSEQKKTVRPYVEKIEKAKIEFDKLEKEVTKNIAKINQDEFNAAIDKAREEGKKQGFAEGLKSATSDVKQKKSKQIKDLASKIRSSDEFDKFLKGAGPLGGAQKASFIDLGSYKEIVANVLEAVASAIELGENVTEAIKKAADKFKDIDTAKLIGDVKTILSSSELPDRKDVMDKISKIAQAEGANNITKGIVDKGLIKDIINSYLGEDLTNNQVLFEATYDLQSILPNVKREDVADAYAERGKFKKETKAKIENEINQKKADVKRLAIKENRLRALESANDYHLEETKEGKKRVTSQYEEYIDEKIKNLLKEKNNIQKEQKVSKSPKTEQDKIDEINKEIQYVKDTKSVYQQAIKDPKKASEALLQARAEREKTYASLGLKLEKNSKSPILVEINYQAELKEIENSYLSESEKNDKIAELKGQKDLDLQGTKQGVVSSLSDDINNFIKSNIENANLNDSLKDILKDLAPTGEKLDDQINKSYNKLNNLIKDENLTKEEKEAIKEIATDLENNNQLTSDELAAKRLKKQWENEIKTAETDIAAGIFTKIPSTTYDFRRNDELVRLNKARENKTGQLNRMVADAKEKTRTTAEKALDLSTKFLVSGIHTAAKVAEAGTFKPFMDSMVDLTAGRVASYITGAPYTSLYSVKKGFKTFAAFKNKEAAQQYIQKLQNNRDTALENLQLAHENGNSNDIKAADKEFKKADLEYAVSTLYNSIESNSVNSFWQYLKHGATDYDVQIGKSTKKDISDYRTVLGKTGYVLDGWIRMHTAMKSSLSARPEMMKVFSSTLKDFQRKGMELNPENISTAMVLAADAYEAGRLTNKTALSKIISRGKGSEKSTAMRLITKGVMPVSTIAVNLAKRGIDYSTLGTEGFVRLATETKKGMKLNEIEGKTYDGLISAIKDGWNRIPLKERIYINGVIGRGLFGSGIMLATMYGLATGNVKYGGTFDDQRKRKIIGSDKEQLKSGEWEFFGKKLPKAASLFVNHLPEFLAVSLIADNYQINQLGGTKNDKFETTMDEVEARLPFQTLAGLFVPGKRVNTIVDRFTRIPIAAEAASLFDKRADFRDKKDFINRVRANIGLGILNPTKEQQADIDEIRKSLQGLPKGSLTPKDEKEIDKAIKLIKNTDYKELETQKAIEEAEKLDKLKKSKKQ